MQIEKVILAKRPIGEPTFDNFNLEIFNFSEIKTGEIFVKVKWLSLDPLKQPMLSFFSSKTDGGMKRTKAVNDREEYANKQCNKNTKKCCVM